MLRYSFQFIWICFSSNSTKNQQRNFLGDFFPSIFVSYWFCSSQEYAKKYCVGNGLCVLLWVCLKLSTHRRWYHVHHTSWMVVIVCGHLSFQLHQFQRILTLQRLITNCNHFANYKTIYFIDPRYSNSMCIYQCERPRERERARHKLHACNKSFASGIWAAIASVIS